VNGGSKGHILGLTHTAEGYQEAKKILGTLFEKDIEVHKVLIKDLQTGIKLLTGSKKSLTSAASYLELQITLSTMKELRGAQNYLYNNIMDKP